jgi:hypothetical protein
MQDHSLFSGHCSFLGNLWTSLTAFPAIAAFPLVFLVSPWLNSFVLVRQKIGSAPGEERFDEQSEKGEQREQ